MRMESEPGLFETPIQLVLVLLMLVLLFLFAACLLSGQWWQAAGWLVAACLVCRGVERVGRR